MRDYESDNGDKGGVKKSGSLSNVILGLSQKRNAAARGSKSLTRTSAVTGGETSSASSDERSIIHFCGSIFDSSLVEPELTRANSLTQVCVVATCLRVVPQTKGNLEKI